MTTERNVAIIPARGGSKRIPRKNIRKFCGKPMILWSIEAAQAAGCFERIVVSTDDPEIAQLAAEAGAEVPFVRPAELSNDYVGTVPVVRHALDWLARNLGTLDHACCLYATAPFVRSDDLLRGLDELRGEAASYAFSVTSFAYPIQRALRVTGTGRVSMFSPEYAGYRSQDLEEAWHDAGQFYWGTTKAWRSELPIFSHHAVPVIIPRHRVQDIDTPEDWERAEWLFRAMRERNG